MASCKPKGETVKSLWVVLISGVMWGQGIITDNPYCGTGWWHWNPLVSGSKPRPDLIAAWCVEAPIELAKLPDRIAYEPMLTFASGSYMTDTFRVQISNGETIQDH